MREYILSVGIAAVIVGIICSIADGCGSTGTLTRMICGLFLAIVAIKPITDLNFEYLEVFAAGFEETAEAAALAGSEMAEEVRRDIIKAQAEAYIFDIASSYNLQVQIEVVLAQGDAPVPESVCLTGAAAPAAKEKLQTKIARELGIPKERQVWTG